MRFRGAVSLLAAAVCALALSGCIRSHPHPRPGQLTLAMVTDVGGLGDKSFNDSAYRGLLHSESGLAAYIKVLQSKSAADYQPNLTVLSEARFNMIYAIGFLMSDDLGQVAEQFPKQQFAIIDAVVPNPNVVSVTFKEEDGSFLAGALAAMVTKTRHIGFIGGIDIPLIRKFEAGYIAGAREIDPNIRVDVKYAGSFDDVPTGKELASLLFNDGADIVYTAAGKVGLGAIDAVRTRPDGYYIIGVDNNQDALAPGKVLTSMVKHVDVAVYDIARAIQNGDPMHGHVVLGLKDGGISLTNFEYTRGDVGPEKLERLRTLEAAIISGRIKVPSTREALAAWKPVAL
ncbi:MAG TPA: BMP family ABC transporter substrate-binding protein [Candidatus Baltobacteraceae bacterium]|nr:BMP family ABC transporter substrate-binding protein [Candidatus Baltobacteraceae bacterium]